MNISIQKLWCSDPASNLQTGQSHITFMNRTKVIFSDSLRHKTAWNKSVKSHLICIFPFTFDIYLHVCIVYTEHRWSKYIKKYTFWDLFNVIFFLFPWLRCCCDLWISVMMVKSFKEHKRQRRHHFSTSFYHFCVFLFVWTSFTFQHSFFFFLIFLTFHVSAIQQFHLF